ncbi:hypothetical protein BGZ80_005115 [Entomortierella chlamydospora]|uniref:RNase III domain-containing protein n=1 Tax=Entomortierella chlamydospora TaxID=101097 RepID=A0A9P6T2C4_9FUNG|nr:hypothetical protein BGZ80_005115 [Entomortierella chlamydospora]
MKRPASQYIEPSNARRPRLLRVQDSNPIEDAFHEEEQVWVEKQNALLALDAGPPDLYACFLSAISLVRRNFSETDHVETKTGLKFRATLDLDEGKLTKRRIDKLYIGHIYSCAGDLAVGTFLSKGSRSACCVMRFVKKTVACAYYRGGLRLALAVTSGIIGPMVGIAAWGDFALKYHQPPIPRTYMRFSNLELSKIEGTLGYNFGEKAVLVESLVHGSFPGELNVNFNYERLEFLGDAVLEFLAALYFLERNQQISDQKLSKVTSHSTSNAALGALCIELKYHSHLRHRKLEQHIAQGIQAFSSKKPWPCYWVRLSIPKVCFADIIESAFGAVFLNSGFDLEAPRDVFDKIVRPFYNKNFIRV